MGGGGGSYREVWFMTLCFGLDGRFIQIFCDITVVHTSFVVIILCAGTTRYFSLFPHTDQAAVLKLRLLSKKNLSHL